MKIALVTFEFEGFTKNGGIGTAYRRLADLLVDDGHQVTVFLYPFPSSLRDARKAAAKPSSSMKAKVVLVSNNPEYEAANPWYASRSMHVYQLLRGHQFDVVHFPDATGMGYHSLLAKRLGLDFADTFCVIGTHGPNYWVREAGMEFTHSPDDAASIFYERKCVEYADCVISPSQYMIDYLKAASWKFPADTRVIPNVNRLPHFKARPTAGARRSNRKAAKGIIFFGRLEIRKGIFLFIEGIRRLLEANQEIGSKSRFPVVFLGKDYESSTLGIVSDLVRRELAPYKDRIKLIYETDLSSKASQAYIRGKRDYLVCMPSLVDNSPYVVVEAVEMGVNFISSSCGGQAELICPDDRTEFLFQPKAAEFADRLGKRVLLSPPMCRPSREAVAANETWSRFHKELGRRARQSSHLKKPKVRFARPWVSVCVSVSDGQGTLDEIADSVALQRYPNKELLVISSDVEPAENGKYSDCRRFQSRISAVRAAKGKYILFLEDVQLCTDDALETFVLAAQGASADVASCLLARKPVGLAAQGGTHREFVIPVLENFFSGFFGRQHKHAVLLTERARLLQTFSHDFDLWSALSSAAALNKNIVCIPRLLVQGFVRHHDNETLYRNRREALRRYETHLPDNIKELPALLAGLYHEAEGLRRLIGQRKKVLEELIREGGVEKDGA